MIEKDFGLTLPIFKTLIGSLREKIGFDLIECRRWRLRRFRFRSCLSFLSLLFLFFCKKTFGLYALRRATCCVSNTTIFILISYIFYI